MKLGKGLEGFGWLHRLVITIGTAKGIHFLHFGLVPGIFDNNISTTNVLLDQNLVPKLSDFGLSIQYGKGQSEVSNHDYIWVFIEVGFHDWITQEVTRYICSDTITFRENLKHLKGCLKWRGRIGLCVGRWVLLFGALNAL